MNIRITIIFRVLFRGPDIIVPRDVKKFLVSKNVPVDCHEVLYVILILWMIWNTADPQTTKIKRANNQGPTGYFSSAGFNDFGTFPRVLIFLLCFSFASLILCFVAGIFNCLAFDW